MTRSVRLQSLAKVNLDLRVLHKRADGFHELRTVFQTISLADSIEIDYQPARQTELQIDDALAIPDNLILRAARAVLEAMKVHARVRFRLKKRIPMGAGLGGGSSNAAAVLLALPVLAGRKVSLEELWQLGAELGSDVPFFLQGGTAVALGRGTEIYNLPEIRQEPALVIASGIHVATGPAYQALERPTGDRQSLTSSDLSRKINDFQLFVRTLGEVRSAKAASASSANDFESAVFKQHPRLKAMWGRLRKQSAGARMTGSGSALFAVFDSAAGRDAARQILEEDRVSRGATVMAANLVNGRAYRRLWQRQLAQHLVPSRLAAESDLIWPPRSRYAR
ncbi:MAG: 4-(cytidine 5'-diphospho)-2-C-methyl-D-erythritol kinase [Bryobacterales bacterium]|nr:4-(cytidine 5'-diphospho)-2-C-methyl-D-erythritol kinase [Bryobacterales bacterium]